MFDSIKKNSVPLTIKGEKLTIIHVDIVTLIAKWKFGQFEKGLDVS